MRKAVKVNYPKKKPRLRLEDLGDVAEPERYSMYQVLLDNLKIANRATFLHRIVYVGEHSFACFDDAKQLFESIIIQSNETYCIEKLSGFLLYYAHYFAHMVEGDEDNLNKHLGILLNENAKHACYLGEVKLLIHVSHLNQRFFENWIAFTGVPPKLLEKLDAGVDLQNSGRYIYNGIKKIYSLIGNYAEDISSADATPTARKSYDVGTLDSIESYPTASRMYTSFSYVSQSHSVDRSEQTNARDYKLFLPEYELLDFIIKTNFTMKLQEYYSLYGVVPMRDIYKDRVWPVPHDFIPYDVFEKPYDCVVELPKDMRKKRMLGESTRTSNITFTEETKENEDKPSQEIEKEQTDTQ